MKKLLSFIAVIVMSAIIAIPASAAARASLVFNSCSPTLTAASYRVSIGMTGSGVGDVYLSLEKQEGSDWVEIDSKSWTDVTFLAKTFAVPYSITEPGTYRCSYSVSATVKGNYDSRSGSTRGLVVK